MTFDMLSLPEEVAETETYAQALGEFLTRPARVQPAPISLPESRFACLIRDLRKENRVQQAASLEMWIQRATAHPLIAIFIQNYNQDVGHSAEIK